MKHHIVQVYTTTVHTLAAAADHTLHGGLKCGYRDLLYGSPDASFQHRERRHRCAVYNTLQETTKEEVRDGEIRGAGWPPHGTVL